MTALKIKTIQTNLLCPERLAIQASLITRAQQGPGVIGLGCALYEDEEDAKIVMAEACQLYELQDNRAITSTSMHHASLAHQMRFGGASYAIFSHWSMSAQIPPIYTDMREMDGMTSGEIIALRTGYLLMTDNPLVLLHLEAPHDELIDSHLLGIVSSQSSNHDKMLFKEDAEAFLDAMLAHLHEMRDEDFAEFYKGTTFDICLQDA